MAIALEAQGSVNVAWLFPGQGAQLVGMGLDAYEASPAARAVFAAADQALGEPLSRLCFEGPLETLTLTANTQPAVLVASAALLAALRERVVRLPLPMCAAGHSLGEYSALVACGAIELADAVRICRLRGRAMQEAVPAGQGAMSAILGVDGSVVAEVCRHASTHEAAVSPANFNAPDQTVVAGHESAVVKAGVLARARGARVVPLKVSAPFHCRLMAPARARLAEALDGVPIAPPSVPIVSNVDATARTEPEAIRQSLIEQVDHPVEWCRSIQLMKAMGVTHALEIGPGRVLAGLVRRIDKSIRVLAVDSVGGIEQVPEFLELPRD